jgi:hypothetical protein
MHYHYHIWYKVPAGYKVPDSVPFTSKEAALTMINELNWSKDEEPEVRKVKAPWCLAH